MGSVDAFAASQGSQHCSSHSCFSGRQWSETDKGKLQTPASLEVSKICHTTVRWIRYFLRELEYFRGTICIWTGFQILPNTTSEEHCVYGEMGLVDARLDPSSAVDPDCGSKSLTVSHLFSFHCIYS